MRRCRIYRQRLEWSVSRRLICRGALPEGLRTAHSVSRSEAGPWRVTSATASRTAPCAAPLSDENPSAAGLTPARLGAVEPMRQRGAGARRTVDCCHKRESQTRLWEAPLAAHGRAPGRRPAHCLFDGARGKNAMIVLDDADTRCGCCAACPACASQHGRRRGWSSVSAGRGLAWRMSSARFEPEPHTGAAVSTSTSGPRPDQQRGGIDAVAATPRERLVTAQGAQRQEHQRNSPPCTRCAQATSALYHAFLLREDLRLLPTCPTPPRPPPRRLAGLDLPLPPAPSCRLARHATAHRDGILRHPA